MPDFDVVQNGMKTKGGGMRRETGSNVTIYKRRNKQLSMYICVKYISTTHVPGERHSVNGTDVLR